MEDIVFSVWCLFVFGIYLFIDDFIILVLGVFYELWGDEDELRSGEKEKNF